MTCTFCEIIEGGKEVQVVYEDERVLAFLSYHHPVHPGHSVIIPKEHYETLMDLPEDLIAYMAATARKLAIAIKSATNCDGINLKMSNYPAAGQIVPHAHLHVIPRFNGDGYEPWIGPEYDSEAGKTLADKIQALISTDTTI